MKLEQTSAVRYFRYLSEQTLLIVIAYSILRIAGWVLSLPTIFGPDSHSYVPGEGLSAPPNGFIGFEKVSFLGDGAIRPWTITLPYALLPADYLRSLFQLSLSIGAFLLLAYCMVRLAHSRAIGYGLAAIVLAFSCTTLVSSWDMLINRESIAISLTAIFISIGLLTTERRSYGFLLLAFGVALLLLVTRPTLAPLVVLVLLVLLAVRAHRALVGEQSMGTSRLPSIARGIFAIVLLVIVVAYPAVYSMRLDASWSQWYGQTMSEAQFGYVVSDYNPRSEELKIELTKTAPACVTDSIPVYTGDYAGAPWGFAATVRDRCPEFATWYAANWPNWYYRYALSHPGYLAKVMASGIPLALRPWDATKSTSPLPAPIRDAMFPVRAMDGTSVYDPAVGYWCILAASALLGWLRWRKPLARYLRENATTVSLLAAVVVGSLLSIVMNLVLVPSYPLETNRINVSTALAIRLVAILGAVAVVARFATVLRSRRKSSADQG